MTGLRRALALAAVAAVVVLDGGAGADEAPAAGSWTQLRQRLPAGDSPDLQADRGDDLSVESGPGGVVSFSAVRAPSGVGALQSLTLAFREPPTGTPVLWACPVTGAWTPGSRQVWQARPAYDCTRHSEGTVDDTSVTWSLSALGAATRQVALVPADGPGAFVALLQPPAATAFTAASASAPPVETFAPPPPAQTPPEQTPAELAPVEEPAEQPAVEVPALASGGDDQPPADAPAVAPPAQEPLPVDAGTDDAFERVTASEPLLPTDRVSRAGPVLLAVLALLAMVRTAVPVGPRRTPRSLLASPEEPAAAAP